MSLIERNHIYLGDCLELMKDIPDKSVDCVICDLPYQITSNKWDIMIPFEELWTAYDRVCKDNAMICLFGSQPFSSALVMSNPKMFRHEWIWIKNRGSNFANTVREPMKEHEHILCFSKGKWTYNKQMQPRTGGGAERVKYNVKFESQSSNYRDFEGRKENKLPELRVPSSWQKFNTEVGLHPTQKPVTCVEYLIKTYTNEGDLVLDNCIGSGTTAIACMNLNRDFIGFEIEQKYFDIATERITKKKEEMEVEKRKSKGVLGEMVKNIDQNSLEKTRKEMLSEIEYEYSMERSNAAKVKFNKNNDVATIYKDYFSPAKVIGECNRLCRQLKPTSDEDFLNKYLKFAEEHSNMEISQRGLTKQELLEKALDFFLTIVQEVPTFPTTFDECLDCLVCHIITETYTGYMAEETVFNELVKNGFTCENTTEYRQDSYYGIDFFTYVDGVKYAVQVKPMKFFLSKQGHVQKDRLAMVFKYDRALNKYKVRTLYAIHNSEINGNERTCELVIKNGNKKKFLFTLEELITVKAEFPKNCTMVDLTNFN